MRPRSARSRIGVAVRLSAARLAETIEGARGENGSGRLRRFAVSRMRAYSQ